MTKTFIQWKGTNLCMDLYCECGAGHHYDGLFAYFIKCPSCGRVYAMPEDVGKMLVLVPKEMQVDKLMTLEPNEFYDEDDY